MRIVSWNIMQGGGKRADGIITQLRQWNPDIVGLSEVRGTEPSQRIAQGLHDMGLVHRVSTVDPDVPNRYGLLLASRFPFQQHIDHGPLHDVQRWIHVELTAPIALHLMAMHVPNRGEGPKYECHDWVVDQMNRFANIPAIAMGDTNTGAAGIDEVSQYFNKRETAWFDRIAAACWIDVWRHRHPDKREYTWFNGPVNGFRLDQLFATDAIEPAITLIDYQWADPGSDLAAGKLSDHAAIVADIDLARLPDA